MDLEKYKPYLKDYRVTIPVGVVLGLVLGLIIGWGIWPVQWTDLAPYHLRQDLREDYLRMSIYASTTVNDPSIATKAWSELEDTAEDTLAAVRANPKYLSQEQINTFSAVVSAPIGEVTATLEVVTPEEEDEDGGGANWLLLGGLCLLFLVLAAGAVYFLVVRGRGTNGDQAEVLAPEDGYDEQFGMGEEKLPFDVSKEENTRSQAHEQSLPVAQFMTTYMVGEDLYDDSFSVEAPNGEFLGECGLGISETVGVGDPKRVTAFEIWLFDKNDIQTVTKVIMSEHAFDDDRLRVRLESKGEPILAEPGKQILLETATLQLEARIIDMEYGEGAAPDYSFFKRLTLELAVWPK